MINTVIPLKRRSAWTADLKLFLLLLGFLTLSVKAGAQCLQQPPQNYYSRVITSNSLTTGSFIQSDYDAANDHIYVPSTFGSSFPTESYLTSINGQGWMDLGWGKRFPMTGNERCLASKVLANGDIAVAGTTQGSFGNTVVFVMMVQNTGALLWAKYFDQNTMDADYRVLMTETSSKSHIVIAASSVSSDNHVLIRMDPTGGVVYYADLPVYANSNTNENFAVINAIAPTSDDGYVLVGSTGEHNNDFFAATAIKYDGGYAGFATPMLNWSATYRHQLTSYDLTMPGDRSSTIARGVMEDPSGDIVVVGYQGDHDQNFNQTTYQNGFIWLLDNLGAQKCIFNYSLGGTSFVSFNGIALDWTNTNYNYIITGAVADPVGNSQTILANITLNPTTPSTSVSWARSYGGVNKNEGFNVFYKSGQVYLSVGISDENTPGIPQAHVIATDISGNMPGGTMTINNCPSSLSFTTSQDLNDPVNLAFGTLSGAHTMNMSGTPVYHCESMAQPCGPECVQKPSTNYYSRVLTAHINQDFLKADYDFWNDDIYVPANYDGGSTGTSDPFWSKVDYQSQVLYSNHYTVTGNEKTRAIKYAYNTDVIIAGTTLNGSGNHILYLMRTDNAGNVIWYRQYDQNRSDVTYYLVVTETVVTHDIVVAASSWNGRNTNILLRVDEFGTMKYYDDHPIFAAGNNRQFYPFFNDITATTDDGYVVVGTTGHNFDFCAAVAYKYDLNYGTFGHVLNWRSLFRRFSAGYDLNDPNKRSTNEFKGVTEAPNGDIIVVGNTSDGAAAAFTATYKRGIILTLNGGNGATITQNVYYHSHGNFQVDFNDVIVDGNNLVITGDVFDPNHWWYHTLVAKFYLSSGNYYASWGNMYGSFNMNRGFSIFKTPAGYVSVGVTNYVAPEFYTAQVSVATAVQNGWGASAPHVLAVDNNGIAGNCNGAIGLYAEVIQNDPPTLTVGSSFTATSQSVSVSQQNSCVFMTELCTYPFYIPPMMLYKPGEEMLEEKADPGINPSEGMGTMDIRNGIAQGNGVKVYPNPAKDQVKLEITAAVDGAAQILVQDITGRTLLVRNITLSNGMGHFDLDISDLSPGTYLIHVSGNDLRTNFPVTRVQKY